MCWQAAQHFIIDMHQHPQETNHAASSAGRTREQVHRSRRLLLITETDLMILKGRQGPKGANGRTRWAQIAFREVLPLAKIVCVVSGWVEAEACCFVADG